MLLDLPRPAYVQQTLPQSYMEHEYRVDPVHSWVKPLTKPSGLAALALSENQIEELCRMPVDWDGYGALPISPMTKYNSLAALRGILLSAPAPDITPNINGTLSFEWETEYGIAQLEIGQTRLSFFVKQNAGDAVLVDALTDDLLIVAIKVGLLVTSNLFPRIHTTASVTEVSLAPYVSVAY